MLIISSNRRNEFTIFAAVRLAGTLSIFVEAKLFFIAVHGVDKYIMMLAVFRMISK
jgi:hypothetical protein